MWARARKRGQGVRSGPYLGEVAHDVEALAVILGHDVEEERVRVVVQSLVVEEALGQETQILGVTL